MVKFLHILKFVGIAYIVWFIIAVIAFGFWFITDIHKYNNDSDKTGEERSKDDK